MINHRDSGSYIRGGDDYGGRVGKYESRRRGHISRHKRNKGGAERKCSRPTLTPTKRYGGISVAIRAAVKEVGRADLE